MALDAAVRAEVATGRRGPGLLVRRTRRPVATVIMVGVVLMLWAALWDRTDFLPSLATTWNYGTETLAEGRTYRDLLATARRLALGLGIGYVGAVAVTLLMRRSSHWKLFFAPHVFVLISTPGLAMSLISLMIFGLSEIGIYLAVAGVVFPFVVVSLLEGMEGLDAKLGEMTRVYHFSLWDRIRHQVTPEMAPFMFAAFRNVHALAWKIVVIAELFTQDDGIGWQYKRAFAFFEFERLIVWGGYFVGLVVLVEYGVLRPIERMVFRWRDKPAG